jgi:hypothetical protein
MNKNNIFKNTFNINNIKNIQYYEYITKTEIH